MVTKFQSLTFLKAMLSILFIRCNKNPYNLNLLNLLSLKFLVQQKRVWDPAIQYSYVKTTDVFQHNSNSFARIQIIHIPAVTRRKILFVPAEKSILLV